MSNLTNRRIVLAARPVGAPKDSDFKLVEEPVAELGANQALLRTIYLSLDPYMRGRMNAVASYAPCVEIGETMVGGAVSVVIASNHSDALDTALLAHGYRVNLGQTHRFSNQSL